MIFYCVDYKGFSSDFITSRLGHEGASGAIEYKLRSEASMDDEILSERECALLVRVDVKTLSRARKRGEPIFPYVQVGDMASPLKQ